MKHAWIPALAVVVAAHTAGAGNLTQENADRVKAVIDAAVIAHGGPQGLGSLKTLLVRHESINFAVGQSRGTEPPWDESESTGFDAVDLENAVFVTRATFDGGGFEGHAGTIVDGEESVQLDLRAGTVARIAEPDFATASGPFVRVTPALLVRTLKERAANAYYLGETRLAGREHDVIGFSMAVGPAITLYFDRKDHALRRSERLLPGAGLVQYEFDDYRKVDGILINGRFRLLLNGDRNIERVNVSATVNQPLGELASVAAGLEAIPAVEPDPLTRQEVAEGIWLIGGNNTYAMFVDMGEYIFAAGGTAGIPERIASLREVAGEKPIRYGMLTHHHFDHVVGVPAYEAEGATVIAAATHEKIARRAAENGDALKLTAVSERMTLESGNRRIEIIDIGPTAHTEHLLVAWLPGEGILFEADHFALPQAGPIPPAVSSTRTFHEALLRHELAVRRFLSAHSPRIGTMDELRAALQAEVYQARR
ncbi:MAG: MBL fold metallo-hydrolase [Woeseiaceae bacterium]